MEKCNLEKYLEKTNIGKHTVNKLIIDEYKETIENYISNDQLIDEVMDNVFFIDKKDENIGVTETSIYRIYTKPSKNLYLVTTIHIVKCKEDTKITSFNKTISKNDIMIILDDLMS